MQSSIKVKRRRCKECLELFTPFNSFQQTCTKPKCVYDYSKTKKGIQAAEKAYRADKRERKDKLKTKGDWTKEAQREFNKWIRNRDRADGCLMCGKTDPSKKYNACHYRSVGAFPELRFERDNVHRGCETCNSFLSGNLAEYRIRLIKKIGIDRVEWLEGPHEPLHLSIDDIKAIKAKYQRLNRFSIP